MDETAPTPSSEPTPDAAPSRAERDADERMSQRERRRERAKAQTPKAAARTFKRYRVHLVILLLFGAIVTAMAVAESKPVSCPGHWHSSMDVYTFDKRVSFAHPKFSLEGSASYGGSMPTSSHMHRTNDYVVHWEPSGGATCIPYGDFLRYIDMELAPGHLAFKGDAHQALNQVATYNDGANGTVHAEHKLSDGNWTAIPIGQLLKRQMLPDERVVVWYGNATTDTTPMHATAQSHTIDASSGRGNSFVPALGVGILGLVVLAAWNALSKRA